MTCRSGLCAEQSELDCGLRFHSLGRYEGVLKQCVLHAKLKGQRHLANELAQFSAELATNLFQEQSPMFVMPIPPSSQGARFRGYSLPQLMTSALLESLPKIQVLSIEEQQAFRAQEKSSKGLSREERLERNSGSQAQESHPTKSGTLILVDDVVTTGATMTRAFTTAKSKGWSQIVGLVLARA